MRFKAGYLIRWQSSGAPSAPRKGGIVKRLIIGLAVTGAAAGGVLAYSNYNPVFKNQVDDRLPGFGMMSDKAADMWVDVTDYFNPKPPSGEKKDAFVIEHNQAKIKARLEELKKSKPVTPPSAEGTETPAADASKVEAGTTTEVKPKSEKEKKKDANESTEVKPKSEKTSEKPKSEKKYDAKSEQKPKKKERKEEAKEKPKKEKQKKTSSEVPAAPKDKKAAPETSTAPQAAPQGTTAPQATTAQRAPEEAEISRLPTPGSKEPTAGLQTPGPKAAEQKPKKEKPTKPNVSQSAQ